MIKNKEKYIKGLSLEELSNLCIKLGYPKYRGNQLFEWMYYHGISSFKLMHNLNKSFRSYLKQNYILTCALVYENP